MQQRIDTIALLFVFPFLEYFFFAYIPMTILIFLFQDVVYALAHATGKTGRFTLIERWRNNERLLAPQEHPLKVNMTEDFSLKALVRL